MNIRCLSLALLLTVPAAAAPAAHVSAYVEAALNNQRQWLTAFRELTEVLKGIKDRETADAAAPVVHALAERMSILQQESAGFAAPSAAEESAFRSAMDAAEVKKTVNDFMAALLSVAEAHTYDSDALSSELTKLLSR